MKNTEIVQKYFDALQQGKFEALGDLFSNDLIWHQPGKGVQSGVYKSKNDVFAHLGNFMKWSQGTFKIDELNYITENGDLVVASLHFSVEKNGETIGMNGVDLFRIENGIIAEVWLFSERIDDEDALWTSLANENK